MKNSPHNSPYYELRMRVPFHDLDPLHMVWHGNYLKYFDMARQGLFESLGVDLYDVFSDTGYTFPIIRSSTKHIQPLRYQDWFVCKAILREAIHKIVVDFELRRETDQSLCAKGRSEQAAVTFPEMKLLFEIPAEIRERLNQ